MIRLRILVEGETEEDFVNEVLRDHLASKGVLATANHLGLHEFETLLFADPANAASAAGIPDLAEPMKAITTSFSSPEEINDSRLTAPSKRLIKIFREGGFGHYDKRVHGNVAALGIGLPRLRASCPQFGAWVESLEVLAASAESTNRAGEQG